MDHTEPTIQMLHLAAATTGIKQRTYAYVTALASGMQEEADAVLLEVFGEGPWSTKLFIASLAYDFLQLCVARDECTEVEAGTTLQQATLEMASIHATSLESIRRLTGEDA